MIGAPLGAQATHAVAPRVLMLLFALLMLVVGALMLSGRGVARPGAVRTHPAAVPAAGFGVGLLTGFLGVGGGFLIVPALTLLAGLAIHRAIGTSLLMIAATSGRASCRSASPWRSRPRRLSAPWPASLWPLVSTPRGSAAPSPRS
jgi:uncharacterized membrane protein YfcA